MKLTNKILIITAIVILIISTILMLKFRNIIKNKSEYSNHISDATTEKTFDLQGFTEIDVNMDINISIVQGENYYVSIEAPENAEIFPKIIGKTLFINSGKKHRGRAEVEISMPILEKLKVHDNAQVDFEGFDQDELIINTKGSATVFGYENNINNLKLNTTGASKINLRDSDITNANISAKGACKVRLTMDGGKIEGRVIGACNITCYGKITENKLDVSPGSNLNLRD